MRGDADIAAVATVLAEPARARMLMALGDGRALPASVLAQEAGVAASTASEHLAKLVDAGLLVGERHGRFRYFRYAGPQVAELLEAVAKVARPEPVRSLRQGTRAHAVRCARLCYDHLAGRLGTALMASLLEQGWLEGGDGLFDPARAARDRLSAPGRDVDYRLTPAGEAELTGFGIDLAGLSPRRPAVRYCVDWSEQRHHLAGAVGAALATRLLDAGWLRRAPAGRAVHLTDAGREGLAERFRIDVAAVEAAAPVETPAAGARHRRVA
jgi:DNA-binding transcriptional ArsR family regulator